VLPFYLTLREWFACEEGQDLIEYGLMIVIAVLGTAAMGGKVSAL